jgi:tRNA 5-methylaminomethyl-2-thiouridine biosynthesis bifunctional protein
MDAPPPEPADHPSPVVWSDDGQPRSRLYGDVYFSAADGLAEARAVFLAGCGLPQAWAGRDRFVVGELGFGTGLNVLALVELWRRTRPAGAVLHVFSVEAHPMAAQDARRALAPWPELGDLAAWLTTRWPGRARGVHRVDFPAQGVILDVAVAEAGEALAGWSGPADAWFLDGFAPARNPGIWRDEVLALVAQKSCPGAAAATFTVAGQVRRGLAAAGFEVARAPGFGRKRERLIARLAGQAPNAGRPQRVAIVGAGIGGASAARAVRALGAEAVVFDAEGRGAGASGNPAALVTPRLDAGLAAPAQLFAEGFRRAVALYEETPRVLIGRGALQLAVQPHDAARFAKVAASDLFEPGTLELLSAADAAARLGEPGPPALALHAGLVIEPAPLLEAWAPHVRRDAVARLEPEREGWRLIGADGATLLSAGAVIVAAGLASADLLPGLRLRAVRGQASICGIDGLAPTAAFGGYAIPTRAGVLFGATNDPGDTARDVRTDDHRRNFEAVAKGLPRLAQRLGALPLEGRASIRAATPDHLPLVGAAPDGGNGIFVLAGFGARGFTLAPLLAEHVASLALGAPSPLATALAQAVDPARFVRRAARRGS